MGGEGRGALVISSALGDMGMGIGGGGEFDFAAVAVDGAGVADVLFPLGGCCVWGGPPVATAIVVYALVIDDR